MEHVRIGEDQATLRTELAPEVGAGVAVVGAQAEAGTEFGQAVGHALGGLQLILRERLGGEQVEGRGLRVLEQGLEHRQVVAEGLAAGRAGHHHRVLAAAHGVERLGLVQEEPLDPLGGQRRAKTLGQGAIGIRETGLPGGDALDMGERALPPGL